MKKARRQLTVRPLLGWTLAGLASFSPLAAQRVTSGLQVLYDFESPGGTLVKDRSGAGQPVDLRIPDPKAVRRTKGALEIRGKTLLRSGQAPHRLIEAVKRSGELTVEVWVKPANTNQAGPARIVTISQNSTNRNLTLGQDGNKFDVRLRTTGTSQNGLPSTSSGTVTTKLTHVVYTRDQAGLARIYLDGGQAAEKTVPGNPSNWDGSYHLALGNEHDGNRPWEGSYYLVALYNRDLSPSEVARNFKAGAGAKSASAARSTPDPKASHFETRVASIFANHCLECHDSATRKGKLDLSRKTTAFASLKKGKALVPGKLSESLLWKAVFKDDMPEEGDPLTGEQKADLKKWIEDGATWTLDQIDPANYLQSAGGGGKRFVQRLTVEEYIATVKAAISVDIGAEARLILPPDLRADGFQNTAYNLGVDLKHIDAYAQLAGIIVSRIDPEKFASRFAGNRRFTDPDMEALIKPMGAWVLRGPLTSREVIVYRGISTRVAASGGTFKEAVGFMLRAMLQSPRFIYRIENQRGDGSAWPADDYELASRLSYIIWGASPDRELMRAADAGGLSEPDKLDAQVKRMLKDPRAVDRSLQFATQWLDLGRLENMQPSPERFPNWDPQLAADMRAETLEFFKEVVWKQNRPLAELLNAQFTHVTPRLAAHYDGKHQRGGAAGKQETERYDLTSNPARGGLLTQGSVLTIGGDDASMVTRGLFVMQNLLRGVVKDPPADVDTTPVPPRPGLSHRGVAERRIADRSCGGCHGKFEPLAFGLEKYDGLGTLHEKDRHGNPLRQDGEVLFPGEAKPVAYKTSAELMSLLAGSDRVRGALTWKVTQFALGRPLGAADAPVLARIHREAQKNGGTWAGLLTAIVTSDLVRTTTTEAAE